VLLLPRFQQFPPGHYFDSKTKEFTRYYNPKFYLDFEAQPPITPSTPYDPTVRQQPEAAISPAAFNMKHSYWRVNSLGNTSTTACTLTALQAFNSSSSCSPGCGLLYCLVLWLQVLREAFTAAVRKRMMSDVPFGVLLSGGLDSSLVASIASRIMKEVGPAIAGSWGVFSRLFPPFQTFEALGCFITHIHMCTASLAFLSIISHSLWHPRWASVCTGIPVLDMHVSENRLQCSFHGLANSWHPIKPAQHSSAQADTAQHSMLVHVSACVLPPPAEACTSLDKPGRCS
jgi:hypothetical protein